MPEPDHASVSPSPESVDPSGTGLIVRILGGAYHVDVGDRILECSLRGRIKQKDRRVVSVGDRVRVGSTGEGSWRIEELLPRRSALTRHGVARHREQVIVANVDQVAAVVAVESPEPDLGMVDRLLALAELNELRGLVVLNKSDLDAQNRGESGLLPDGRPARLPPGLQPYLDAGYEVIATSASRGTGLEPLAERLAGRITVLSGQSGVGKSSLLNALLPGLDLRVAEVGRRAGRHTTVAAALYRYPGGGYVADTPGLQYLALWEVEPAAIAAAFPEMRRLADGCRFADCRHRSEPGCRVRDAVESGALPRGRYESYRSLLAEAEEGR